jgi:hypothetical protein
VARPTDATTATATTTTAADDTPLKRFLRMLGDRQCTPILKAIRAYAHRLIFVVMVPTKDAGLCMCVCV